MKINLLKTVLLLLTCTFSFSTAFGQSPEKMSYQAVIRDAGDNLITDTEVGMQISILQGSASGEEVYVETQEPTTNANGLVSIEIGTGTTSDDFSAIDWADGPYFIKTETDPEGSTNYTITGTSQLLSVPYALHAKTADTVTGGITETDPVYESSVASGITGEDTTNWNNKLDSESDPVFDAWDKDYADLINIPDLSDTVNYLTDETDPVYESSVASGITGVDTTNWNNKLDSESDPVFDAWDKDYADLINIPDLSDTVNYLTDETDPIFTSSEAANITATDITNLDNLSGTNTGDQDLSTLATKTALGDSTAQVRNEIPDVSGFISSETDPQVGTNSLNYLSKWDGSALVSSTIFDNGNVGINTTDPDATLHVNGDAHITGDLVVDGSTTGEVMLDNSINDLSGTGMMTHGTVDDNATGIGAALYMASDGNYEEANAGALATMPCVALALETGTGDKKVLLQGNIRNDSWTLTPGGMMYVSLVTGKLTQTRPSATGEQVQIVGYATSTNTIFFNPNLMLIEIK